MPLAKVAAIVQKELVLIETDTAGEFRLEYKKDIPAYQKLDIQHSNNPLLANIDDKVINMHDEN